MNKSFNDNHTEWLNTKMTEYEEKFSSIGNPINKYIISPLEDVNNAAKTMGVGNITKEVEADKEVKADKAK